MATPHIGAEPGAFAETVLMPGDPLRARFIAERWLTDVALVTSVRNMFGYTGLYRGKRLSVMGHGMGIPSISIYATELIKFFGVKNVIRVGSCGAIVPEVGLGEIVVAMGASTDSKVNRIRLMDHDFAAIADYGLLERAVAVARRQGRAVHIGNVFASDLFYSPQEALMATLARMRILAVEMELSGLYGLAAEYGAKALGILTVSDQLCTGDKLSAEERQTSFGDMIEIALETAADL